MSETSTDEEIRSIRESISRKLSELQTLKTRYYQSEQCLQNVKEKFNVPEDRCKYQLFAANFIRIGSTSERHHFRLHFERHMVPALRNLENWDLAWILVVCDNKFMEQCNIVGGTIELLKDQELALHGSDNYHVAFVEKHLAQCGLARVVDKYSYTFSGSERVRGEPVGQHLRLILVRVSCYGDNWVQVAALRDGDGSIMLDPQTRVLDFKVYHTTTESVTNLGKA